MERPIDREWRRLNGATFLAHPQALSEEQLFPSVDSHRP